jgi:glutaredoxin
LHEDFDREFVLEKFAPQTTFPFIVIDNVLIGGYTDLMEHYKKETA